MAARVFWWGVNLVAVVAVFVAGVLLGGYLEKPKPPVTRTVQVANGEWMDVPMRITTGDGTAYTYSCDLRLRLDGIADTVTCDWPEE